MSTKIVKYSAEELQTCKLKDITNVVKAKFTEEESNELKTITEEKARREYLVKLYNKYIDEVIEESAKDGTEAANPDTTAPAAPDATSVNPDSTPATPDASDQTGVGDDSTSKADENKEKVPVNTNVFFTVSVKGVTGYSGTISCSCEHLLKIAFLNSKSVVIEFRTQERAKQFINIVKNVKSVKGLPTISEATRVAVINRVKEVNGIK